MEDAETPEALVLERLRGMRETELHQQVIAPILRKLATNVVYTHGPQERGKDFIFITNDAFGGDVLNVCQVKNDSFSGKATSKKNTAAVLNQLRQCARGEVLNPVSNVKERPQSVWLWTTYPVPDKDTADHGRFLQELRELRCTILGPDSIVSLVRDNLPGLFDTLAFSGDAIAGALQRYLVVHHEAAALKLRQNMALPDFYVSLGVVSNQVGDLSSQSQQRKGGTEELRVPNYLYEAIRNYQRSLPVVFRTPPVLEVETDGTYEGAKEAFLYRIIAFHLDSIFANVQAEMERLLRNGSSNSLVECLKLVSCANGFRAFLVEQLATIPFDSNELQEALNCQLGVPAMHPGTILEFDEQAAIYAEAGSGKTCFARMVALSALEMRIPIVYFPCSEIRDLSDELLPSICRWMHHLVPSASEADIMEYVDRARFFVLDGCDEAATYKSQLGNNIRDLMFLQKRSKTVTVSTGFSVPVGLEKQVIYDKATTTLYRSVPLRHVDYGRLEETNPGKEACAAITALRNEQMESRRRCVITSRDLDALELTSLVSVFSLKPLSDIQLKEFFERRLGYESTNGVMEFLQENSYVHEVCRRPLTATLLASIRESQYDLPRSLADLYATRFRLLLDEWDRGRRVNVRNLISESDKMALLSRLAIELHVNHRRSFTTAEFREIWSNGIGRLYPTIDADEALSELRVSNSLIESSGYSEFSLGHLSFQEFLTARAIMHLQRQSFLVDKYFDHWWQNVTVFYAGLCGDISAFLEAVQTRWGLVDDEGLLGRLVAEARHTSPALVDFLRDGGLDDYLSCADDDECFEIDDSGYDFRGKQDC